MKKNYIILGLFLLNCFLFYGCSTPERIIDPTIIPELRGYIRTTKKVYKPNEIIEVNYYIENVTEKALREQVIDGSKDPGIAFQGYSFNAVEKKSKTTHLDLKNSECYFKDELFLMPAEKKKFFKNTFIAKKTGDYELTFRLQWRNSKKIIFKPISLKIRGIESGIQIDPKLKKYLDQLGSKDPNESIQARDKLIEFGAQAVPYLIKLLGSLDKNIRSQATFTLIEIGRVAVPGLLKASKNKDSQVRMRVIHIFGQIGGQNSIAVISNALLYDKAPEVRIQAIREVSKNLAKMLAIPLLIKALEDENLNVRREAIDALKKRDFQDFGYLPTASMQERKQSILLWKKYWNRKYPNTFKE